MPRRQLVRVSGELTAKPVLAQAPMPAVPFGASCDRPQGCYSNRQLETMLTTALDWGGRMADQLDIIRGLMAEALKGNTDAHDPAAVPGPHQRREDR